LYCVIRRLFSSSRAKRLLSHAPIAVTTGLLAAISTRAVLDKTGGVAAVPLDDAFIHFQYARSFAELKPFVYSPGAEPVPGATSLLWPLVLAPFWAIGVRGTGLIWVAWTLSWVSLGLLAHETRRTADSLMTHEMGWAAAAMVLAFGGYIWFAGSGMEVVPFAWLLMRSARRVAEWAEGISNERRARLELLALALLSTIMRPEGVIAAVLVAVAWAARPRGRSRAWALLPVLTVGLTPLINWAGTGQATSTTAIVKWLPYNPYNEGARLAGSVLENFKVLFGTLLDGRIWSSVFLPSGGAYLAWLALPALVWAGFRHNKWWRAATVLAVGAGMFIPTSYDSFLWNRLRYLWPFAAAWFVGLAALADAIGDGLAKLRPELKSTRLLIAGGFVGALAGHVSYSIDDLAVSADAIRRQQAELGHWARGALPDDAIIGVNDTGAIAYFAERRVFDVVGLTTAGEARYWTAGAGSRFEHYERLDPKKRPTHFIVYPEWLALSPLLGASLTERYVPDATILGGTTMAAHQASFTALHSGAEPENATSLGRRIDELDVADLESEAAHRYELFWATQTENIIHEALDGRVDGARAGRTLERFELELAGGATLVARLGGEDAFTLLVRVAGGRTLGALPLEKGKWFERSLGLPRDLERARYTVEVEAPEGKTFVAMHYWVFATEAGK
jgi:hypothetical protein